MQFQVLLSLWRVTSGLWIDKIPEVAKTKVSKPKINSYIKVKTLPRPPKTANLNTPPHVYIMVWEDLQFHQNVHAKKVGVVSVTAVVLMQFCRGEAVFLCQSKSTLFGLSKVDAFKNHYDYLQQNINAFYGRQFCEPKRGGNFNFATTSWCFWISDCMFC